MRRAATIARHARAVPATRDLTLRANGIPKRGSKFVTAVAMRAGV